jgi:phosphoglycerate dehydrogenase-like enzyme
VKHSSIRSGDRRSEETVVSLYPTNLTHLAEAVAAAKCTVASLNFISRGLVMTGRVAATDLVELLSQHPRLEWVQLPAAGVDSYLPAIRSDAGSRLTWTSAKGAFSQPVAKHALALSLALLRLLHRQARSSTWTTARGTSLAGLNVVVIGAGGIAIEIIRLLTALGAVITVVRRKPENVAGVTRTVQTARLPEVLVTADLVVIAAALTESTTRLLGKAEFAVIKSGANIVNIARGGLVDTDELLRALHSGRIAGAALDVTDPEPLPDGHSLWAHPGVLITPHSADTAAMKAPLLAKRIQENAGALHTGGDFIGIVSEAEGYRHRV